MYMRKFVFYTRIISEILVASTYLPIYLPYLNSLQFYRILYEIFVQKYALNFTKQNRFFRRWMIAQKRISLDQVCTIN